jgi:glycerophosphoryl diester phosphodiesterase
MEKYPHNLQKKSRSRIYWLAVVFIALIFLVRAGEIQGTIAMSSDLEKSEKNKFAAGQWGEASKKNVLISEVYYNTDAADDDDEFVELYNPTSDEINLFSKEYKLGDEETKGAGEGMYKFPDGSKISSKKYLVVAKKASAFENVFHFKPDLEFIASDPSVPDMVKYTSWATGQFGLGNSDGDEALLLDKDDNLVDGVSYDGGSLSGVTPHSAIAPGLSLQRFPKDSDTNNCAIDFMGGSPKPGE